MRDENSYHIVYELTSVNPQIHLDPVLIYGFQKEISAALYDETSTFYLDLMKRMEVLLKTKVCISSPDRKHYQALLMTLQLMQK